MQSPQGWAVLSGLLLEPSISVKDHPDASLPPPPPTSIRHCLYRPADHHGPLSCTPAWALCPSQPLLLAQTLSLPGFCAPLVPIHPELMGYLQWYSDNHRHCGLICVRPAPRKPLTTPLSPHLVVSVKRGHDSVVSEVGTLWAMGRGAVILSQDMEGVRCPEYTLQRHSCVWKDRTEHPQAATQLHPTDKWSIEARKDWTLPAVPNSLRALWPALHPDSHSDRGPCSMAL